MQIIMSRNQRVAGVGLLCLALFISVAGAQSNSRTIMRSNDDGTHEIVHITSPDIDAIRKPDFMMSDVPIFTRTLLLSKEQTAFISMLIKEHLENFAELVAEFMATEPMTRMTAEQEATMDPARQLLSMKDVEDRLPKGANVSTGVSVSRGTSGDEGEEPLPPHVRVDISIDVPEGEELSPALEDEIRDRVNRAAQLIKEQLQAEQNQPRPAPSAVLPATDDEAMDRMLAEHNALLEQIDAFVKAKARLRANFVAEAHTILWDEQVTRWPALERALYRDRNLSNSRIPGEGIDLLKILDEQDIPAETLDSMADLIEAYDVTLDGALRRRDAYLADAQRKIDQAIADRDPEKALTISDRVTSLRVATRSVNQQFATSFREALGDDLGEAFAREVLTRTYPRVYRTLRGQKAFAALKEIEADLDPQTRAALADLRAAYEVELSGLNDGLRRMIDDESPKAMRRQLEYMRDAFEGRAVDMDREDPVEARFTQRAEVDDRYCGLIMQSVGPKRADAVPPKPSPRRTVVISSGSATAEE